MEVIRDGSNMKPTPLSCITKAGKHEHLLYPTDIGRNDAVSNTATLIYEKWLSG